MKQIWSSLKVGLLQRIESPLLGSFGILFVLFNWRAFAVFLFSAKPIEERLSYIEQTYCHPQYYFWLPAAFALALTFAHPYMVLWVTRYLIWIEQKKDSARFLLKEAEIKNQIQLSELESKLPEHDRFEQLLEMERDLLKASFENHLERVKKASNSESLTSARAPLLEMLKKAKEEQPI